MDHFEQTPGTDHGQGETDEALLQKMEQEQLLAAVAPTSFSDVTQTVTTMPNLLDERAAAKLLGISPRKLWGLADAGEIPFIKVGPRLKRYDPRDLEDYVERNRCTKRPAKTSC